jgi:Ran GTPase-activating protein (RanGAP) involved in mRNA processing and transport
LLPCLRSLSLRNNCINDEFEKEILAIFENKKIVAVDLSHNKIGPKLGNLIGKALKECSHIQWIDLNYNEIYSHKEPQLTHQAAL